MAEDLWLDPRLPPLVEIREPTRQQTRRITRRVTPCGKCRRPLTADDICFADGQDAHRSCAEHWNYELFEGFDTLNAQDLAASEAAEVERLAAAASRGSGLILPEAEDGALWIPPSMTPAAPAMA